MRRTRWFAWALIAPVLLAGIAEAQALKTNTQKALVPLSEIISGGPPPDGIPAIDHPKFVTPEAAEGWIKPQEPVLAFEWGGEARAYPLQILIWHEIVNDAVGGKPVTVTFCPLCNSALVFERTLDGKTYDFGTSGMLYKSDLVMYDRQTHSLWAQMEGRAIVGDLAGTKLRWLPANTLAFGDWRRIHPGGKVLSRDTGFQRQYGLNPYEGYDRLEQRPLLFAGKIDGRLQPMERVVGVRVGETAKAYPFALLTRRKVVTDTVGGKTLVVFHRAGTVSALDEGEIAASRDVGATGVFEPVLDGKALTFEAAEGGFRDRETGSLWSVLGKSVKGPLAGKALSKVPHIDAFWFAWAAFNPETQLAKE